MQGILGFQNAGCVGIHDLVVLTIQYAHDPVAGGLCLGGGNGELLTHQPVHQGGFAHIGLTHNAYKTGFE